MQSATLEFQHATRAVYTAVKHLLEMNRTKFSGLRYDDGLFFVEARHGLLLSPFSEAIKIKVVATGASSCRVVIESSSRSLLNLLNFGANKGNVSDLSDYINNEVYRLQDVVTIDPATRAADHSTIRIVKPDIRFK